MTNAKTQSHPSESVGDVCSDGLAADILDGLGAALLIVGRDQVIRYRNAAAKAWFSDAGDLDSALCQVRWLERFSGWSILLPQIIDEKESFQLQCAVQCQDESAPVLAKLRCVPLFEKGIEGPKSALILIEKEVRQEAIEEKLEVTTRLASLGKLATRVAHELNNPLDGILRYVNLAIRLADDTLDPKLKSYLTESRTGLIRMVEIIGDLLSFSRATDGEFDGMNLNEVIEQAIKSNASAAEDRGVVIAADFQSQNMPSVCGSRLYQVCGNLIRNAIDAMPDGGRLCITSGIVEGDVVIRVSDTGMGLPEPVEIVFEPFFTTKEPGKGTGLGLAICKDFVENMQGTIAVEASEEGGAVFTVRIPRVGFRRPSPLADSSAGGAQYVSVQE